MRGQTSLKNLGKIMEAIQYIIIRKDLKMPPGKIAAQASHASVGALLKLATVSSSSHGDALLSVNLPENSAQKAWLMGRFAKVALRVESEEELLKVFNKAQALGVPCALIKDAGLTTFHNVPTFTCVGIGPVWRTEVKELLKDLRLY
jgi:peptidyl-tRNA hydrolase, PTH2 family